MEGRDKSTATIDNISTSFNLTIPLLIAIQQSLVLTLYQMAFDSVSDCTGYMDSFLA
jgi:hypothetical protein